MHLKQAKLNTLRLVSVLLLTMLLLPLWVAPVSAAESGTCGETLSWAYDCGTLTISGSGAMTDFTELEPAPWAHLSSEILRVLLPDGLTSIGDLAFYDCKSLRTVTLPKTVLSIGHYAFAHCESLSAIGIGAALRTIGNAAFYGCYRLDAVRLPYGIESIGYQAFYRCESLSVITLPEHLSYLGGSAFAYCKNLVRAEVYSNLSSLPDWTFYGCELLSVVVLPSTVTAVDNYALKNCNGLSAVYHGGSADVREDIKADISRDMPEFDSYGVIATGAPAPSSSAGTYVENEDGTVTQSNITVRQDDDMTIVSVVSHTRQPDTTSGGSYTANVTVTVEETAEWESVSNAVTSALKTINDTYTSTTADSVSVDVYLREGGSVNGDFLEELEGRELKVTVNTAEGSSWKMDCNDLGETVKDADYSYQLSTPKEENKETLGTDNCYGLQFENSAEINAEVIIALPKANAYATAYLYQVEKDGTYTRLQAVVIDGDSNVHLYLASVEKGTEYVIGINVPGENSDDAIYPDEVISSSGGNPIDRLAKIEYVTTGVKSSWGLDFMQVTWIMLAVLAVTIIIVGTVMAVMNKKRLKEIYSIPPKN